MNHSFISRKSGSQYTTQPEKTPETEESQKMGETGEHHPDHQEPDPGKQEPKQNDDQPYGVGDKPTGL